MLYPVENENCLKANKYEWVRAGNLSPIALFLSLNNLNSIYFFQKMMNDSEQIKEYEFFFYTSVFSSFAFRNIYLPRYRI